MIARRYPLVSAVCSLVLALTAVGARADQESFPATTDSPRETVATLILGLVQMADRHGGGTVEERYRFVESFVVRTHDLPYIAEFALRRQWGTLTEEQRLRFVETFQRLSVMTYAARFRNVANDAFRVPLDVGEPDANGRVQVTTAIKREGQPDVSLEYLVQREGADWKIINIVADGVSDLALKRAEYQRVFASGGIEGLIAELGQQTDRLDGG